MAALWALYVTPLLPALGIIRVGGQAMADKYAYLPTLGLFFVTGYATALAYEKTSCSKAVK